MKINDLKITIKTVAILDVNPIFFCVKTKNFRGKWKRISRKTYQRVMTVNHAFKAEDKSALIDFICKDVLLPEN